MHTHNDAWDPKLAQRAVTARMAQATAPWLWLLLGLFCFRVMAQLAVIEGGPAWLPSFEYWHSGALPYGALVASQLLLIVIMARTALVFSRGAVRPRRRFGQMLGALGLVYLVTMLVRLVLGLTLLPEHPWFGKALPAVFHLALAGFVLLVSRFHLRASHQDSDA